MTATLTARISVELGAVHILGQQGVAISVIPGAQPAAAHHCRCPTRSSTAVILAATYESAITCSPQLVAGLEVQLDGQPAGPTVAVLRFGA
jgi:hypothetical protein